MEPRLNDVSGFIQNAALAAHDVLAHACAEESEAAQQIKRLVARGGVQFNVVIRDVLGGMPRIDLVAVAAEGEFIVGSRMARRTHKAGSE